jgi:hypothetical protein
VKLKYFDYWAKKLAIHFFRNLTPNSPLLKKERGLVDEN